MRRARKDEPATFDFVIVGAGSAGCVLASRLSEDSDATVALIEAGPSDGSPLINVPLGMVNLIRNPRYNWCSRSVPQRDADGRVLPMPRGRVLGGTSAINGMVYMRGHRYD